MSLDWLYDLIRAALPAYGADNVFRARQRVTLPTDDFITYRVLSYDTSAQEYTAKQSDLYADPDPVVVPTPIGTFDRTYQQNVTAQIQIDCYSADGIADLWALQSYCRSSIGARAYLDPVHAAFAGANDIRDLSALADNGYENRFTSVFTFAFALDRTESLDAILHWEISGLLDDIESTIIV